MEYIGIDIETLKKAPDNEDGDFNLGIACISIYNSETLESKVWYNEGKLNENKIKECIDYLLKNSNKKTRITSYNGCGFDFKVIFNSLEDEKYKNYVKNLAMKHVDIAFQMLCEKGYMTSLNSASLGCGFEEKTMNGADVPELWEKGEYDKITKYCKDDAKITTLVAKYIEKNNRLEWTSKSGNLSKWFPVFYKGRLLSVKNSLKVKEPDVSWMSKEPWKREKFTNWI